MKNQQPPPNRNVPQRQQQSSSPPAQQRGPLQRSPEELGLRNDIALDTNLFKTIFDGDEARANRFMASSFAVIRKNPDLLEAERRSLVMALGEAAVLDLNVDPQLGECYLIPRYDKNFGCKVVNFQTGYKGLLKLMNRGSSGIDWVSVEVVRSGEHFRQLAGTDPKIEHEIPLDADIDESDDGILAAYCVVMLRGSTRPITAVVRRTKLLEAASRSGDPRNNTPSNVWRDHFEAMCKKTAIRRVAKLIPGADDAKAAIAREEAVEQGRQPDVLEQLRGVAQMPSPSKPPRQPNTGLDALVQRQPPVDRQSLPSAHPDAEPPEGWDAPPPYEEPPQ